MKPLRIKQIVHKHTCGRQVDPTPDPTISAWHTMCVWKRAVHKKLKRGENHGGARVSCPACKELQR